ncbi:MAG: UbiA family prenyltransferase, partial [Planctomycetota bacterium]|nr:UbiA family prenyltransferase [Planctomycetota bacterium]
MRVRLYFELVRLPNVIAAPADSLAGMLLVGGTLASWSRALPLALTSACLYAAGMALNDVCDIEVDCVERPGRPLPSGRVSLRTAAILAAILTTAGLGFALLTGSSRCVWVAAGVAGCIVAYDAYFKKTPLGPLVMGLCRGGNLLLGMSVIPGALRLIPGVAVASMTLFVAGVTWISRSEIGGGRSRGVLFGVVLENVGLLGCLSAALVRGFPNAATDLALIPLEGLLILLAGAFF